MALDFISGKHTTLRYYFLNQPWNLKLKSWSIEEVAVESDDDVNGEDRTRTQKLTKYFRVSLDPYEDGSSAILQNYIANQANEDANQPQIAMSAGIVFRFLDGTKGGWTFRGITLGPLNINSSGRTERVMHKVTFRAAYFSPVPTV